MDRMDAVRAAAKRAAEHFEHYESMTDRERALILDTGLFNSYIEAYLVLALQEMDEPADKIKAAVSALRSVLDTTTAEEAAAKM